MAYQEQQGVLAAAQQHEALLQGQAQSAQQELEQLRAEARKSGQYSDLQRQFQEVLCTSTYLMLTQAPLLSHFHRSSHSSSKVLTEGSWAAVLSLGGSCMRFS